MSVLILVAGGAVLLWSLVAHHFSRFGIAWPLALATIGALVVVFDEPAFKDGIDGTVAQHVVELVLAVLLFVDACEVKGGLFGQEGRSVVRLVLIALPLSLALVVGAGVVLLPGADPLVLVVIACIIMPTDFAVISGLLRSDHVPARVRQILNVESGYNDGLIAPVFGMALAIALYSSEESGSALRASGAGHNGHPFDFWSSLFGALPAMLLAVVVGVVLGGLVGLLSRWCSERGLANAAGLRYAVLLVPVLAYGIATLPGVGANGFVTAFVAGVAFRLTRTRGTEYDAVPHEELRLVEDVGTLTSSLVWFVLGALATTVLLSGIDWRLLLLVALSLTVFRVIPVLLAMTGSGLGRRDRVVIGLVGPRGTPSIVFGLLAFNALTAPFGEALLEVTVLAVVGSIVLHGLIVPSLLLRRPLRHTPVRSQGRSGQATR